MAEYDPLMYAPHAPGAPPPPQQNVPQQNNPPPQQEEPLFIGPHNLVGPRLPPIDDIVANDPEIRRICSELATLINNSAINKTRLVESSQGLSRAYHTAPYQHQQYMPQPPIYEGWGNVTENTFLQEIKYYVRMATNPDPNRRRSFNFQQSIDALQTTIQDKLNTKYMTTKKT
jgi:hypothetical protein